METKFTRRLLLKALLAAWTAALVHPQAAIAKDGGDGGGGGGGGGDDGGGDDGGSYSGSGGGDDGDDGNDDNGGKGRGRGRARRGSDDRAWRSGEGGLKTALKNVRTRYSGRVVEVELNKLRGRRVYEIKVIDNRGRLFEVYCDVRNGNILKVDRN